MRIVRLFIISSAFLALAGLPSAHAESAPARSMAKELPARLDAMAALAAPAPSVTIPAGWFLMGSTRVDDDPYGLGTQYDDTELPQHRVWLDAYEINRDEVSLGELLAFFRAQNRPVAEELQKLIWHMITVHAATDDGLARWPALYVTWAEASDFCRARGRRLPTEAEWEKAARGVGGLLFPWGKRAPTSELAVFGQYHVHEIPLVQAVATGDEGRSPYGLHHMAGNVSEWVQDWFPFDYYAITPDRNPTGPREGRYRGIRGGSWKSRPMMLRTATRSGSPPEQRAATTGFRCAASPTPPR